VVVLRWNQFSFWSAALTPLQLLSADDLELPKSHWNCGSRSDLKVALLVKMRTAVALESIIQSCRQFFLHGGKWRSKDCPPERQGRDREMKMDGQRLVQTIFASQSFATRPVGRAKDENRAIGRLADDLCPEVGRLTLREGFKRNTSDEKVFGA